MSRTFDVLERIQQDRDLFRVPPITKAVPTEVGAPDRRSALPDVASFAREEILRLVQHLFLATENISGTKRRQVVFCGIDNIDGSNLLCARIGRILAEQVQSQVCVVDANVRVPPSSPLVDLLPFDDSQTEGGSTKGASRRVTENLWLASGDSACRNGASPTLGDVQTWISGLPAEFAHVVISAPPVGFVYRRGAARSGGGWCRPCAGGEFYALAGCTQGQAGLGGCQRDECWGRCSTTVRFPIPEKIYRLL